MKASCLKCRGRDCKRYCKKEFCATCHKLSGATKVKEIVKENYFQASSVTPFIGRFGYPNINVGLLSPARIDANAWKFDAPKFWAEHRFHIPTIVDFRSSLLNSRSQKNVTSNDGFIRIAQEVALSSKPVDAEFYLDRKPNYELNFDDISAPTGPAAKLEKAKVLSNPKIDRKVYSIYEDKEIKAQDAALYLNSQGYDENSISRMFSVGALGMKRKLVPTRWSITATDDMLGKDLINKIREYPKSSNKAFFAGHLGNYYLVLLLDEIWGYELFEMNVPNDPNEERFVSTDFETFRGRKDYASNTVGGYYTVRLAVLEHLEKIKKQASVVAFRFITDEYELPLGVWVTREAARNAMRNNIKDFNTAKDAIGFAYSFAKDDFNYDISSLIKKSVICSSIRKQTKLNHWSV